MSHREPQIDVWTRGTGDAWNVHAAHAGGTVEVAAIGCALVMDDVRDARS